MVGEDWAGEDLVGEDWVGEDVAWDTKLDADRRFCNGKTESG